METPKGTTEMKKPARKKVIAAFIVLIAVSATIGILILYNFAGSAIVDHKSAFTLNHGATYQTLLDSLGNGNRITNPSRFRKMASLMKLDGSVKPGYYELRPGMSAREVVGMFRSGNQKPVNLTFNNIRTLEELAGRLGYQLEADSTDFLTLLRSDSVATHYGFTKEEFIGMFIPNTYQIYWTATPSSLIDRMKKEHDRFWRTRKNKLERTGLTEKEVSTLASIVEEETNVADEMPTIAGVYINRLRKNIKLQADPTVKFAAGDHTLRRVLRKHLETDSPYNTYKHYGLPPGPIRMPSVQALEAVLDYQEHDYIFFCAKADFSGRHAFAKTLAEHNRNARAYSRALNAAGIK